MIEEQLIEKTQNWNVKQWRDYLFQNGVMDIETFRQKCYDIVDEWYRRYLSPGTK